MTQPAFASRTVDLFDTTIEFDVPSPVVSRVLSGLHALEPQPSVGTPSIIYRTTVTEHGGHYRRVDPVRNSTAEAIGCIAGHIEDDVHLSIAANSRAGVFIHAGVVAIAGRAIVLPGRSHSGKSRLVRALVLAGAEYLSDEFAVVLADGRIRPYPRNISIRSDGPARRVLVDPEDIGRVRTEPLDVGLVLFTKYERGIRFNPEPITPGYAALRLMKYAVTAISEPDASMRASAHLATNARLLSGRRPHAEIVAPSILDSVIAESAHAA